jgi:hypothetical protein
MKLAPQVPPQTAQNLVKIGSWTLCIYNYIFKWIKILIDKIKLILILKLKISKPQIQKPLKTCWQDLKNKNLKTPKSKKPGKGGDPMNGGVDCPFCSHGKPITWLGTL